MLISFYQDRKVLDHRGSDIIPKIGETVIIKYGRFEVIDIVYDYIASYPEDNPKIAVFLKAK